jgi:hypothetical protein
VSFADTAWAAGPAPLGYGDAHIQTTVSFGPSDSTKYVTTYFRHAFNVISARDIVSLVVSLMRDDGAVVYLNGTEIFRSNMPVGTIASTTRPSNTVAPGEETSFFDSNVDPSLLVNGKNVIAVEVHQVNGPSTDLGFDLQLAAQVNFSNRAPSANAGPDLNVQIPAAATLRGVADDDALPNPPGVFTASWSMVTGPGSVSFADANLLETSATFSQAGTYLLRLAVSDGQLTATDDVQVTVTGGSDPYAEWKSQNFTSAELSDPAVSGDNADPDRDTFSNQQEFIAGTRPKDGTSFLHVIEVNREQDDFAIRFEALGDKSYTILGRDSVEAGPWARVVDLSPQGQSEEIEVLDTLPQTSQKKFYRIVTPRLPPE